jgi:hypothetical protein
MLEDVSDGVGLFDVGDVAHLVAALRALQDVADVENAFE